MSDNRTTEEKIEDNKTDLQRFVTYMQKYENELSQLNNSLIRLQQSGKLTDKYKSEINKKIIEKRHHLAYYKEALEQKKKQIQKLEKKLPARAGPPPTPSAPDFIPTTNPLPKIEKPKEEVLSEEDRKLLDELEELEEEENAKKAQQQQQNLSERERIYEEKTGKKYNPLITDDEDAVSLSEPDNSIPLVSTSKTKRKTPTPPIEAISSKVSNKTKKKRPTPEGIELYDLSRNRPVSEQFRLDDVGINKKHFTVQTGYSETLVKPPVKNESVKLDESICQNIFSNGLKVNKGHFFPSQFPKLTRIKPITVSNKKGGKRKTRKNRKIKKS